MAPSRSLIAIQRGGHPDAGIGDGANPDCLMWARCSRHRAALNVGFWDYPNDGAATDWRR
jgi:hypothetical protein